MKSSLHHGLILAGALLASGLCPEPRAGSSGSFIAVAQADDTIVMSRCTIKGSAPTNKGQQLFDSAKDGRVIGQFSGAIGPLSATLPMELGGRAKVSTSAGKPTVRLDGWLPTSALTIFAAKDIPVLQGNLWLATGYQVKPSKVTSDQLTSELTIQGTQDRKIRGTASCDSYSLNQVRPVPYDIPGNARGYLTKGNSITLFDNPNGTEILELAMEDGASQLFWSTESRGGFVHVLNRGDIVVDAWIRFRELSALKKGEMMDQHIPPSSRIAGVQLKLEKEPRVHTASKNIPIRVRPDDKAPTIGVIESGAEFLEVGTTAKWLNILPKDLYITPPTDGGFWVPADAVAAK